MSLGFYCGPELLFGSPVWLLSLASSGLPPWGVVAAGGFKSNTRTAQSGRVWYQRSSGIAPFCGFYPVSSPALLGISYLWLKYSTAAHNCPLAKYTGLRANIQHVKAQKTGDTARDLLYNKKCGGAFWGASAFLVLLCPAGGGACPPAGLFAGGLGLAEPGPNRPQTKRGDAPESISSSTSGLESYLIVSLTHFRLVPRGSFFMGITFSLVTYFVWGKGNDAMLISTWEYPAFS